MVLDGTAMVRSCGLKAHKQGTRWQGYARYKRSDGSMGTTTHSWPSTLSHSEAIHACEQWARAYDAQRAAADAVTPDTLLGDMADAWVRRRAAAGAIERSTVKCYMTQARRIARYMPLALRDVTPATVQQGVTAMRDAGLSASSIRKAVVVLRSALRDAATRGDIACDPLGTARPECPKPRRPRPNPLPAAERDRLLLLLGAVPLSPVTVAAYLALEAGLRQGEACALRWRDVGDAELTVEHAIGNDGAQYVKAPKTDRARCVPISQRLRDVLSAWRAPDATRDCYVLSNTTCWQSCDAISRGWRALAHTWSLQGVCGVPTYHHLRDTFATTLLQRGADVRTVSELLGHASTQMTLDVYCASSPDAKQRAVALL